MAKLKQREHYWILEDDEGNQWAIDSDLPGRFDGAEVVPPEESKVGKMSVEISADTQEFEDKLTSAKELADQLLESLSKIPDVKVEVKSDINGDKSS